MIQYGICVISKHIEAKYMEKDYNDILKNNKYSLLIINF